MIDKYADDQASFLEILIQSFWANVCKSVCFILCVFFLNSIPGNCSFKEIW